MAAMDWLTSLSGFAVGVIVGLTLLATLLIGSIPGVMLGGSLSRHAPGRVLRSGLAAMLFLASAKLVS